MKQEIREDGRTIINETSDGLEGLLMKNFMQMKNWGFGYDKGF